MKIIVNEDLEICCWLYNRLRELRMVAWKENETKVFYSEQQKLLPKLKEECPF